MSASARVNNGEESLAFHIGATLVRLDLLNPKRRLLRWPLKAAFLGVVVLFTLFPNPFLLFRHVQHWSDLASLIDPEEPAIAPLVVEVQARLAAIPEAVTNAQQTLKLVETVVYEHIPYAWDWDVWGCADYLPTAAETMQLGCEDCDGRAVVAASVLRKLGHEAELVTDGSHMWVRTESGDTMSPMPTASGRTLIRTTDGRARFDPLAVVGMQSLLIDWPKSVGFGVAVFPLGRVLIIAAATLLCLFPRSTTVTRVIACAVCVICGLMVLRWQCHDPWNNSLAGAWMGLGLLLVGGLAAAIGAFPRTRESSEKPVPLLNH